MSRVLRKVEYLLLAVICLLALAPMSALASQTQASGLDLSKTCALSISTNVTATFDIYKVANMTDQGDGSILFTLVDSLQGKVDIDLMHLSNNSAAEQAAVTLSKYTGSLSKEGSLTISENDTGSVGDLAPGLYLVTSVATGKTMNPVLVSLPTIENGRWVTTFEMAATKFSEATSHKVIKKWEDSNDQYKKRPTSVTVMLLADTKQTGMTADLNEENGWSYTWTGLPKYSEGKEVKYSCIEVTVPDEYEAMLPVESADGTLTTITNKYTGKKPNTETPDTDKPKKPGTPGTPKTGDTNNIMLYVILLVVAVAGISLGVGMKRRKKN